MQVMGLMGWRQDLAEGAFNYIDTIKRGDQRGAVIMEFWWLVWPNRWRDSSLPLVMLSLRKMYKDFSYK